MYCLIAGSHQLQLYFFTLFSSFPLPPLIHFSWCFIFAQPTMSPFPFLLISFHLLSLVLFLCSFNLPSSFVSSCSSLPFACVLWSLYHCHFSKYFTCPLLIPYLPFTLLHLTTIGLLCHITFVH